MPPKALVSLRLRRILFIKTAANIASASNCHQEAHASPCSRTLGWPRGWTENAGEWRRAKSEPGPEIPSTLPFVPGTLPAALNKPRLLTEADGQRGWRSAQLSQLRLQGWEQVQPKSAWARSAPSPYPPVFSAVRNGHGCLKPPCFGVVYYTAKAK